MNLRAPSTLRRALAAAALALAAPAAAAGTIHVDSSLASGADDGSTWADALQGPDGLERALALAVSGDEIFVAQGSYLPTLTGNRLTSLRLVNGVEVYGGFVGGETDPTQRPPLGTAPSILTGDLNGDDGAVGIGDNSFHVVNGAGTDASAVLDGFWITAGNATGNGNGNRGGGIICVNGSSPTIRNCRVYGNRCTFGGGAGYINGTSPSFTDCVFEDNEGGSFGGAFDIATAGAVRFERCFFQGNEAARAGALEVFSSTGVVVSNCVFVGNTATGTGGGGAIWIGSGGNTAIRNCTVVDNTATNQDQGGLRLSNAANTTIANSIFWANTGSGGGQAAVNQVTTTADVTWSLVAGGHVGAGNIDGNPWFRDEGDFNYALSLASPAVDAGNNALVVAGVLTDYAGDARLFDSPTIADTGSGAAPIVDMGAFELGATRGVVFCAGDGSANPCPCGNVGDLGHGCASSVGGGARLSDLGTPSVLMDDLRMVATGLPAGAAAILFVGASQIQGGGGAPFGDGLRCVGGGVRRLGLEFATATGDQVWGPGLVSAGMWSAGDTRFFQVWHRDPTGPCGGTINTTAALALQFTP